MDAPRVELYTTPSCPYCVAAKRLLDKLAIAYVDVDVARDAAAREAIVTKTGWRTVPVVLLDGELVGGYTELSKLHSQGGLDALLP